MKKKRGRNNIMGACSAMHLAIAEKSMSCRTLVGSVGFSEFGGDISVQSEINSSQISRRKIGVGSNMRC